MPADDLHDVEHSSVGAMKPVTAVCALWMIWYSESLLSESSVSTSAIVGITIWRSGVTTSVRSSPEHMQPSRSSAPVYRSSASFSGSEIAAKSVGMIASATSFSDSRQSPVAHTPFVVERRPPPEFEMSEFTALMAASTSAGVARIRSSVVSFVCGKTARMVATCSPMNSVSSVLHRQFTALSHVAPGRTPVATIRARRSACPAVSVQMLSARARSSIVGPNPSVMLVSVALSSSRSPRSAPKRSSPSSPSPSSPSSPLGAGVGVEAGLILKLLAMFEWAWQTYSTPSSPTVTVVGRPDLAPLPGPTVNGWLDETPPSTNS